MVNPYSRKGKEVKDVKAKTHSKLGATQHCNLEHHPLNNAKIEFMLYAQILDNQGFVHRKLSDYAQNLHKSIVPACSEGKMYQVNLVKFLLRLVHEKHW